VEGDGRWLNEEPTVAVRGGGQARLREAEIILDRRQRDVHDRLVEDDHQETGTEDDQRDPARIALVVVPSAKRFEAAVNHLDQVHCRQKG
jgi:hypothetical protein